MKIMYVDHSIEGHHLEYLRHLAENKEYESLAVLPQKVEELGIRQIVYPYLDLKKKKISDYLKYIKAIKKIATQEKVDVIHFLDGDSTMRYFDVGYRCLKRFHTVVTFHHLFPGKLRELSMKSILKKVSLAVVHTDEIEAKIKSYGCKNVETVHYPCFLSAEPVEKEAKQVKTLLALGGTRYDKGVDILLAALKNVKVDFRLIIAGKEEFFSKAYIENAIKNYQSQVDVRLKFLTNDEMLECLQNADIIILPYRKEFDGASGPLCEGAYLGKTIIGPSHGSLGAIIKQNHLGYCFESEDPESLAECISDALRMDFSYDQYAKEYQRSLNPYFFLQKYTAIYRELCKKV